MFSVRYTDGTACEINSNRARETVIFHGIQFVHVDDEQHYDYILFSVCEENGHDGIVHLQEVSSCYYEIIVTASWLCKILAFRYSKISELYA
jgi:hypothetical protein